MVKEREKYWKKKFNDDEYILSDVRFYVADKVERGLLDQVHERGVVRRQVSVFELTD
jgi:hypothetical protein